MKKYAGQKLTSYVQVYFSYTDPSVYENYIEWTGEKDLTNEDQSVSIPVITNTYVYRFPCHNMEICDRTGSGSFRIRFHKK